MNSVKKFIIKMLNNQQLFEYTKNDIQINFSIYSKPI